MSKYTQTKLNRLFEGSVKGGVIRAIEIAPATPHEPFFYCSLSKIERECLECGSKYLGMRRLLPICSEKCRKTRGLRIRPQTFKKCEICNKEFGPVDHLGIRFCSRKCGYIGRKGDGKKGKHYPHLQRAKIKECMACGKEFRAIHDENGRCGGKRFYKQQYCSLKCKEQAWIKNVRPVMAHNPGLKGELNGSWKGDFASYSAMHQWIWRQKGKPSKCEKCGTTRKRKYEWANKYHTYKREMNDYVRLCTSCHRKHDIANFGTKVFGR